MHPLARRGPEQVSLVEAINVVLRRDGYGLSVTGEESGYPVFRLGALKRGVAGAPKNLISHRTARNRRSVSATRSTMISSSCRTPKAALSMTGLSDGLVYSGPNWSIGGARSIQKHRWIPARALGLRLREVLASDAERGLFDTYFRLYRPRLGPALPALIPQVYLPLRSGVVKHLRRRAALPRQRMDFLLLLPNNQRVVIEVDGAHHFSVQGKHLTIDLRQHGLC